MHRGLIWWPTVTHNLASKMQREKQASHGTSNMRIYGRDQKVFTPWKKFLSSGRNKENLVAFLLESWSNMGRQSLGELQLYVTSGEHCTKLYVVDDDIMQEQVDELSCDHDEEADTRLLLHAAHAGRSSYPSVVIKSPDTDVFVLALFSKLALPETSWRSKQNHFSRRCIKRNQPGTEFCFAWIHAFTGTVLIKRIIWSNHAG